MIKNSQVMKYFLCRFIREKITVEGIAEKWGRVLYFSAIIAAVNVNVNIHKPNRKFLRRLDDRGLVRLNWSPRDEELSVDKIKENVNQNFKADFFFFTQNCYFWPKMFKFYIFGNIWLVVCWTNSLLNCLYLHLSLNCLNIKITLNESDKITYNRLVCYFDFIHRSNSAR